jgi:hypothetical protein
MAKEQFGDFKKDERKSGTKTKRVRIKKELAIPARHNEQE